MRGTADVCIVAQAGAFGGAETHTLGLIETMAGRGLSVILVEAGSRHYEEPLRRLGTGSGLKYRAVAFPVSGMSLRSAPAWWRVLRSVRAPVVVLPRTTTFAIPLLFFLICRLCFRKVFAIEHTCAVAMPKTRARKVFGCIPLGLGAWRWKRKASLYLSALLANRIIAVSNYVKDSLVANFGIHPSAIRVIHSGVDVARFARSEERGRAFKDAWGIPSDPFIFGTLGRLAPEKGIDLAVRAAALLAQGVDRSSFRLVVVGSGACEDSLRKLVSELQAQDLVVFVPFVPEPEQALSAFDAIVLPSRMEALGLTLLEGMAAGCIPVVARVGGMPEVIPDPGLGWVVEPENPAALARAMSEVLGLDAAARAVRRRKAVDHVAANFESVRNNGAIVSFMLS